VLSREVFWGCSIAPRKDPRRFIHLEVGVWEALISTTDCGNNYRRWQKFAILAGRWTGRCARPLSICEVGIEDTESTELKHLQRFKQFISLKLGSRSWLHLHSEAPSGAEIAELLDTPKVLKQLCTREPVVVFGIPTAKGYLLFVGDVCNTPSNWRHSYPSFEALLSGLTLHDILIWGSQKLASGLKFIESRIQF